MPIKIKLQGLMCLLLLLQINCIAQEENAVKTDSVKYKPVAFPSNFSASLNEIYTRVNEWEGRMVIFSTQR